MQAEHRMLTSDLTFTIIIRHKLTDIFLNTVKLKRTEERHEPAA